MSRFLPLLAVLFSINLSAQTPLPYYTGFESGELEGWAEYNLGPENSLYTWQYSNGVLAHDYPVGGTLETHDWFVSPGFDFSGGGAIDSVSYRFSGFGTPIPGDTIGIYLVVGSQNPDEASELIMLREYTDSEYNNDFVWRVDTALTIPETPGISYIAFRYSTIVNWLVPGFDDLYISSNGTSTDDIETTTLSAFPNPANSTLYFTSALSGEVEIYNLNGRLVQSLTVSGDKKIDISQLETGLYLLSHNEGTIKFLKD